MIFPLVFWNHWGSMSPPLTQHHPRGVFQGSRNWWKIGGKLQTVIPLELQWWKNGEMIGVNIGKM
jgi:hypothetical protein